jgi:hypothetical protein
MASGPDPAAGSFASGTATSRLAGFSVTLADGVVTDLVDADSGSPLALVRWTRR